MRLNFLGRGSCFANDHAAAFFVTKDNNFVLIDCSEQTYQRIKNEFDLSSYKNIYVYITHTHGDHVGGLGILIQYAYYALNKHIIVISPDTKTYNDISTLLKIEGVIGHEMMICSSINNSYNKIATEEFALSIPTEHSKILEGRCFGYQFNIEGVNVIYTGDTVTLEPFIPYLKAGTEFYVDTSVAYKSDAHLWFNDMLPTLKSFVEKGVKVYLMHLDDAEKAEKLVSDISGIEVVNVY